MVIAHHSRTGIGEANYNYKLLDGVSATANGEWVPVAQGRQFTFEVSGIVAGDVVTAYGAIDDGNDQPDDSAHRQALDPTFTTNGIFEMTARIDFIKARLTNTGGGGTVTMLCKVAAAR